MTFPFPFIPFLGGSGPASFVFNGADENLTISNVTSSPSQVATTLSLWIKRTKTGENGLFANTGARTPSSYFGLALHGTGVFFDDYDGENWDERTTVEPAISTWEHWVFIYDSANATTDNRIQFYQNGSLLSDAPYWTSMPTLNEESGFFVNGTSFRIGRDFTSSRFGGRLAFIDVLDGVIKAPTDFAFDDGGTWTRKPYTGSYGSYGFSLTGENGFNDSSGNSRHFTGVNMSVSENLDREDLPPYTL